MDDGEDDYLPPSQTTGPDANGIKTIIDWKFNDKNEKIRITRKVHAGATVYHHRLVGETIGDEVSRSERTISMREYKALKAQADPMRLPIRKTRRAFIWKNDYYMLDTFHEPRSAAGVTTLFVERPVDPNSPPDELPAFIKLREDVTTKVWFSSYDAWNRKVEGPKDEHAIG